MAKNEVATLEVISCVMKPPQADLLCLNSSELHAAQIGFSHILIA